MCSWVEVTGEGFSQVCCGVCGGVWCVSLYGWNSVHPAFGHGGSNCELHVECVFVTSALKTTSSCVPVQPHMTIQVWL